MIRPFLAKMTKSELHAICTGGFATVAGSTMGGYIAYKVHVTTWFNKNPQQILQILILQQKTYSRRCNNWSLVESSAKCVEKLRFFRLKCLLCSFLWQVPLRLRNVRPRRSRYGQTVLPRNEENKDRKWSLQHSIWVPINLWNCILDFSWKCAFIQKGHIYVTKINISRTWKK